MRGDLADEHLGEGRADGPVVAQIEQDPLRHTELLVVAHVEHPGEHGEHTAARRLRLARPLLGQQLAQKVGEPPGHLERLATDHHARDRLRAKDVRAEHRLALALVARVVALDGLDDRVLVRLLVQPRHLGARLLQ